MELQDEFFEPDMEVAVEAQTRAIMAKAQNQKSDRKYIHRATQYLKTMVLNLRADRVKCDFAMRRSCDRAMITLNEAERQEVKELIIKLSEI